MASLLDNDRIIQATAVGGEPQFAYDFPIKAAADPVVKRRVVDVITTLVLDVDYSVTGVGDVGGGQIVLDTGVFPTGATAGDEFTIFGDQVVERAAASDFAKGGDFFAATINSQLDDLTRISQDLRRDADASLKKDPAITETLNPLIKTLVNDKGLKLVENPPGVFSLVVTTNDIDLFSVPVGSLIAGDGLELAADTISIDLGTDPGLVLTAAELLVLLNGGTLLKDVSGLSVNVGTGANQIVQLDGSAKLPAVDGSQLTEVGVTEAANIKINALRIATLEDDSFNQQEDGIADAFTAEDGVDLPASTNEVYDAANNFYSAPTTKTAKSFTGATQTFVVPAGVTDLLIKAWGAGGGSGLGTGPGGGGGFVIDNALTVTPSETLDVEIGGGGQNNTAGASNTGGGGGGTGIYRSGTVLAIAGGGGGGANAGDGGAGGGSTGADGEPVAGSPPTGGTQMAGGTAQTGGGNGSLDMGGDVPADAATAAGGFNGGGDGDGDNTNFTSGGGGAGFFGGGSGGNTAAQTGGGAGGSNKDTDTNTQAIAATGAGQGDADYPAGVGDGGSASVGENGAMSIQHAENLTLISNTFVAEFNPSEVEVLILHKPVNAVALNTDFTCEISRDGGVTYSLATLTDEGEFSAGINILRASVDVTGQPAAANVEYRLKTLNAKEQQIHGIAMAWT